MLGVDEKEVKKPDRQMKQTDITKNSARLATRGSLRPNGGMNIKTPVSPAGGKVDWLKSRPMLQTVGHQESPDTLLSR